MILNDMIKTIDKIHLSLYHIKASHIHMLSSDVVKIIFFDDEIKVDHIIKNRIRITFSEYVGKIGDYREIFGKIMENNDNICDTSDFIDLTLAHAEKISKTIEAMTLDEIKHIN